MTNRYSTIRSSPLRYGYGSVFAPRYDAATGNATLSEPTGRYGCMIIGTKPDPATLEETYCNIYSESNHNASKAFPWVPGSESYSYGDIAKVFNTYVEGVRKGECPEYFPYKENDRVINAAPVDWKAAVKYIVKRVQSLKKYTSAEAFVQTMFYHAGDLYAKDEKLIRPDFLWPLTFDSRDPGNPRMNNWYDNRVKEIKDAKDKDGAFAGINDLLSNVLTLVVVGVAIYVAMPLLTSRR